MQHDQLLQIICCPRCRGELTLDADSESHLCCSLCAKKYPVVNGIPVLLDGEEDEISVTVREYYDARWRKNDDDVFIADRIHLDLSPLGQRYIRVNEERFLSFFKDVAGRGKLFLDVGSGAHPRIGFSENYAYHVCVDFSLSGLLECRRLLGAKGLYICASALALPIRDGICDAVLASHCLYHIDKTLQPKAVREFARVSRREARVLILYRNPTSLEQRYIGRWMKGVNQDCSAEKRMDAKHYYYVYPIRFMLDLLSSAFDDAKVRAKTLRLFSHNITAPLFKLKPLGRILFSVLALSEKLLSGSAGLASYVAYTVEE